MNLRLLLIVAILGAACAHASNPTSSESPTSSEPSALPSGGARCSDPGTPAETFWFRATDGTRLDGAMLGSGTAGVVLAHQYPADLCGWWPYAAVLARKGFRVLLFDFRCFGLSTCPTDANGDLTDDLTGAVAELRRRGATSVALLGASLGATVSLMTAPTLTPTPDAVVSLSGEPDLGYLVGSTRLDAMASVGRLSSPVLFVVARGDLAVSVKETRSMFRAAGASDKRLVVLPSAYGLGWNMVIDIRSNTTPASRTVLAFLRQHLMRPGG